MSRTDHLLENHAALGPTPGEHTPGRPALRVAIVACMDARIDPVRLFALAAGDAHVIRNAGGVITDDVIRSLVVSQRLLGTEEIVVVHHTRCGMAQLDDAAVGADIETDAGRPLPFALGGFPDIDAHLVDSLERLRSSPFLPHRDGVRGFVYDVDTGRLREITTD